MSEALSPDIVEATVSRMAAIVDAIPAAKTGRPRVPFAQRMRRNEDCIEWLGSLDSKGYAGIWVDGKRCAAHRFFWEAFNGPIAQGLQIDHLCRNRVCVNPAHLEPVTLQENVRRSEVGRHNREKQTCPRGHKYDYFTPSGERGCLTCRAEVSKRGKAKKRGVIREVWS